MNRLGNESTSESDTASEGLQEEEIVVPYRPPGIDGHARGDGRQGRVLLIAEVEALDWQEQQEHQRWLDRIGRATRAQLGHTVVVEREYSFLADGGGPGGVIENADMNVDDEYRGGTLELCLLCGKNP